MKSPAALVFLLATLVVMGCQPDPLEEFDTTIRRHVAMLAHHSSVRDSAETLGGSVRIAVLPFALNGQETPLGQWFGHRWEEAFSHHGGVFAVIDKSQVSRLVSVVRKEHGDLYAPTTVQRLGQFEGVNAVCIGTYLPLSVRGNRWIEIQTKLLAARTAKLLGSSFTIRVPEDALPVNFDAFVIRQATEDLGTAGIGALYVSTDPEGASVTVEGGKHGITPAVLESLETGTVVARIVCDGFAEVETSATIEAGRISRLEGISLAKLTNVRIESKPTGAALRWGGEPRGHTPLTVRVLPGRYEVRLEYTGFEDITEYVDVLERDTLCGWVLYPDGSTWRTSQEEVPFSDIPK